MVKVRAKTLRPQITPFCLARRSTVPFLYSGITALVLMSSLEMSSFKASLISSSKCRLSVMGLFIVCLLYGFENYALILL